MSWAWASEATTVSTTTYDVSMGWPHIWEVSGLPYNSDCIDIFNTLVALCAKPNNKCEAEE